MRHRNSRTALALVVCTSILLPSCASTPVEVVRLSSTLGEDLVATQTSYQLLIAKHFENLRQQANDFVDYRWRPAYLRRFIKDGDLVKRATDPDPSAVLTRVGNWAQVAVEQIDAQRKALVTPINDDEKGLKTAVDEAFNRMIRANSSITAHLNSIRKVTAFQDEVLTAAGVGNLRDTINKALIDASNKTQQAIDFVDKADGVVTQIKNQVQ
jgi:hypothetical protein